MALLQTPIYSGTAAGRPTSGNFTGQVYVAADTGAKSVWNGSSWQAV